ncbi:MAG TPA: hypothetical protein VFF63_04295 [Candidatus Babeliales bacterium]|nr:hypothetical protein [Candidatus Babeliales bacterium]
MTASRAGAIVITLIIVALNLVMPGRYRFAPAWLGYGIPILMVGAMAIRMAEPSSRFWQRVEKYGLFGAAALAFVLNTLNLLDIIDALVYEPATLKPEPLFFTAVSIWVINACTFALIYWLIDRGGPDARASGSAAYPDFDFPAMDNPTKVPPGWQPHLIDYLFIGFTTNTAFGPTEAMPLTVRAKSLMIVQSAISLADIVVVAARAIGAIG